MIDRLGAEQRSEFDTEREHPPRRARERDDGARSSRRQPIQRKLEVGSVDDPLEREADAMASQVERLLRSDSGGAPHERHEAAPTRIRRASSTAVPSEVGRDGGDVSPELEQRLRAGGGSALDGRIRPRLESAFGADFGDVRVHRDSADAPRIGAKAFTIGNHVHFAPGEYDPSSAAGQRTLAHELTHVVQQGAAGVHRRPDATVRRLDGDPPKGNIDKIKDAIHVFEHYDPKTVGKIADAWFAKKKGDADAEKDIGKGVKGGAQATGGAGGAGWALGNKGAADLGTLGKAYQVLASAGLVAGADMALSGALKKELGENTVLAAKGSFKAFAGMYMKAVARGFVRKGQRGWWDVGVGLSGKASAMAGVKAKGDVETSFKFKDLGVDAGAEAEAFAGAEVSAEGDLIFDPAAGNIAIGGKLSAFAGAKASAKGKFSGTLYGRQAIKFKVGGSVSAGVGGTVGGKFSLKGGTVKIKLDAQATLGLGAGGSGDLELDMKPFAVFAYRQAHKRYWALAQKSNPEKVKDRLANPKQVEPKLGPKLEQYAKFKQAQLGAGTATNYVKIEKVQMFIDEFIPRQQIKGTNYGPGVDAFLQKLLIRTLKLPTGLPPVVDVKDAKLKKLEFDNDAVGALSKMKVKGANPKSKEQGVDLGAIGDL